MDAAASTGPKADSKPIEGLAELTRNTFRRDMENAGMVSFVGDPKSMLMLNHYANHHQQLCLRFQTARDPGASLRALT